MLESGAGISSFYSISTFCWDHWPSLAAGYPPYQLGIFRRGALPGRADRAIVVVPSVRPVLAEVLPFKGTYYIPISIYIGKLTGMDAIKALGFQLVWLAALVLLSTLSLGVRLSRGLVVQGG